MAAYKLINCNMKIINLSEIKKPVQLSMFDDTVIVRENKRIGIDSKIVPLVTIRIKENSCPQPERD